MTALMDELVANAVRTMVKQREAELVRLLGLWVSEVDPTIFLDAEGRILGLGHAGELILPARTFRLEFAQYGSGTEAFSMRF